PELVVCDLAGTTIRDGGEVPAAFEAALRETGLRYDPAELGGWRGASKREVVARLLDRQGGGKGDGVERVYRRFRAHLLERLSNATPLSLPRVHETFELFKAGGIGVAVTTGFDREVIEAVLAGVSWAPLLDAWICGDDVTRGRPAPFMIFRAMERCG